MSRVQRALDFGTPDSLRYRVGSAVTHKGYDRAIADMEEYFKSGSPYPNFASRVDRYVKHSIDLIHAIESKKNFPGMSSLTTARQQELQQKAFDHLEELLMTLRKIEKVEHDLRAEDVKSTVWIVKAIVQASFAIVFVAFAIEISGGLLKTAFAVIDDSLSSSMDFLLKYLVP